MCYMCEENNGEYEHCQDCGVAICFDAKRGDDWPAEAGVTSSGDLYCMRHAVQNDRQEEEDEEQDEEWGWMPGPWDN